MRLHLRLPAEGRRRLDTYAVLAAATLVCGCATAGNTKPEHNPDPFEGFNRGVWKFNDSIDRHALKPVAKAYRDYVPKPVQTGVGNFFTNLFYPTTIVNQFLQGKFKQGGQDTLRLAINTTLGWGGLLDVASGANLPIHDEDSGQTLGRWGVPPGPYLVIPLIGPATVRDAPARIADDFLQPFRWYDSGNQRWFSLVLSTVDTRARLLPLDRLISEAYDPYVFVRDAFLQRRLNAVWDGNPPGGANGEADDANWAEEAIKEDESAAPAPGAPDGASEDQGAGAAPGTAGDQGAGTAGAGSAAGVDAAGAGTTVDPEGADAATPPPGQ